MNVLSLFDGCSGGRIALDKLGAHVDNYFASEIDKYAMHIAKKNYPDIIHVGDVTKLDVTTLPKIDLLIGGSPCTGFSRAGTQLNFKDPHSKLFFNYVDILNAVKPKYFLLENVVMKKEYQDVISEYLGVEPININSALLSAQSRNRLYWVGELVGETYQQVNVPQPTDKGLVMQDILEHGLATEGMTSKDDKAYCLTATYTKASHKSSINRKQRSMVLVGTADNINGHDSLKRVYSAAGKAPTLNTMSGGNREPKVATSENKYRKLTPLECERLQTMNTVYRIDVNMGLEAATEFIDIMKPSEPVCYDIHSKVDKHITLSGEDILKLLKEPTPFYLANKVNMDKMMRALYDVVLYSSSADTTMSFTFESSYTEGVSNSQRYKMIGNGWTTDVISHILGHMIKNFGKSNPFS